uniref:Coiled-coil domain-containing protein 25 n=1 Tax=Macaca mulatta TaxID=9544 RepID=A0A5F7ZCN3_MACMU
MFIVALFTIAKTWNQPQCPSMTDWIKKMWHIDGGVPGARRSPRVWYPELRELSTAAPQWSHRIAPMIMVFYFTRSSVNSSAYTIYMGKDKYENEDLIKHGWPEDIWERI